MGHHVVRVYVAEFGRDIPSVFSASCDTDSCKARGINGGRKGAVVDEHGGDGTEIEAEKICVWKGRTPRVEGDRDVDTGTNGTGTSDASGKLVMFLESGGVEAVLPVVGEGRGNRRTTTDDDDDKQATTTTAGLAILSASHRGGPVSVGAARTPSKVLIPESKVLGVPEKEMSGLASAWGEGRPTGSPATWPGAKPMPTGLRPSH